MHAHTTSACLFVPLWQVKDDKGFKLKNFESMKEQREQIKRDAKDKKEALMGIGKQGFL